MKSMTRMRSMRQVAALCLVSAASAVSAHAHFSWTRIADGTPPRLEVRFSEGHGEATTPDLLARVKDVKGRTADGSTIELKPAEGRLEGALASGARVAGLGHTWGVM